MDLSGDGSGDLDIAASMEDLEAQISQAADELAREGRRPESRNLPSTEARKQNRVAKAKPAKNGARWRPQWRRSRPAFRTSK